MSRNHLNRGAVTARRLAVLGCQLLRAGCPDVRQFLLGFLRDVPWVYHPSIVGPRRCFLQNYRGPSRPSLAHTIFSTVLHVAPIRWVHGAFAFRIARSTQSQLVNDKATHPLLAQLTAHKFCVRQPDNRQCGVATSHDSRRRKAVHSGTPCDGAERTARSRP